MNLNPSALLSLIGTLYAQLDAAEARIKELEPDPENPGYGGTE